MLIDYNNKSGVIYGLLIPSLRTLLPEYVDLLLFKYYIAISNRVYVRQGSSDSITNLILLLALYEILQDNFISGGVFFGLVIHMRSDYLPPIYQQFMKF